MAETRQERDDKRNEAAAETAPPAQPVPLPAPKPLTVPESLKAFRDHTAALKAQLARGSKSDLDQVGARLDELVAWMDAVIDDKHHNPPSVAFIHIDPVAAHAAEVDRVASEKAAVEKAQRSKS